MSAELELYWDSIWPLKSWKCTRSFLKRWEILEHYFIRHVKYWKTVLLLMVSKSAYKELHFITNWLVCIFDFVISIDLHFSNQYEIRLQSYTQSIKFFDSRKRLCAVPHHNVNNNICYPILMRLWYIVFDQFDITINYIPICHYKYQWY